MKTHKDRARIVHFESEELGVKKTKFGSGAVFYPPHAWVRVLAWGKKATHIGHEEPPGVNNTRHEFVVFDGENSVAGIHPSKMKKK